ncbi:hypothetical protein C7S18_21290 [Ahniella affigens]|uniref:Uncharacterized protein n=1 Tax=Ahniella affigens TaxID=2021234 RepID=A0A2P1PXJ4_9GAMM|nr:hypothetical protein C7S18_21290 [Ahniella affigens]
MLCPDSKGFQISFNRFAKHDTTWGDRPSLNGRAALAIASNSQPASQPAKNSVLQNGVNQT